MALLSHIFESLLYSWVQNSVKKDGRKAMYKGTVTGKKKIKLSFWFFIIHVFLKRDCDKIIFWQVSRKNRSNVVHG
jgi:hypothetical protein